MKKIPIFFAALLAHFAMSLIFWGAPFSDARAAAASSTLKLADSITVSASGLDSISDYLGLSTTCSGSGWCGAHRLNSTTTNWSTGHPSVGISTSGAVVAVFTYNLDGVQQMYAKVFDPSTKTWGSEKMLSDGVHEASNGTLFETDVVAVNASGQAAVVWKQSDGTSTNAMAVIYDPTTGWGTAQAIDATSYDVHYPKVAMDDSGNAVAIWVAESTSGSRYDVYGNHYEPATGWGTAQKLESSSTAVSSAYFSLDMGADGTAFALWSQDSSLYAAMYTVSGGWSSRALVESSSESIRNEDVRIATDGHGNAAAIWVQYEGSSVYSVFANYYKSGSGWQGAKDIDVDDDADAYTAHDLRVDMDDSGNVVAVWDQYVEEADGSLSETLWNNSYSVTSSSWSGASAIETGISSCGSSEPELALNGSGKGFVVYGAYDGDNCTTYARARKKSGVWDDKTLIGNPYGGSGQFDVAVNSSGDAAAVWHEYDATFTSFENVYANIYSATPAITTTPTKTTITLP